MKTIYYFIFAIATVPFFTSCSSYSSVSNGAFSDVSLNRDSSEYTLQRLDEINVEGKAFCGIPSRASKRKGVVFRFNGLEVGKSNQAMPIISLLFYIAGSGYLINEIVGVDDKGQEILGLGPSMLIGVPIGGILNNSTWTGAALQNASWNVNDQLLQQNPEVDVFLNPKYDIEYQHGLFTQKATVKARVMGATLKTDD